MSVPGPVALHGGGEFEPGDEPFLDALLTTAAAVGRRRRADPGRCRSHRRGARPSRPRGRPWRRRLRARRGPCRSPGPGRAGHGPRRRLGRRRDARRRAARPPHVIHFPGGEPALIPRTLPGTPALAAIEAARRHGRRPRRRQRRRDGDGAAHLDVERRRGGPRDRAGDRSSPRTRTRRRGRGSSASTATSLPPGIGLLGLAERTGVDRDGRRAVARRRGGRGPMAHPGAAEPIVGRSGDRIDGPTTSLPRPDAPA